MVYIFRGMGCIVPIIVGFCVVVGALGGTIGLTVGLLIASGLLWFVGRSINGPSEGNEHTFYFIPVQYWSFFSIAGAIASIAHGALVTDPARVTRFQRASLELSTAPRATGASEFSVRLAEDLDSGLRGRAVFRHVEHVHVHVSDYEAVALVRYDEFEEEDQDAGILASELWDAFRAVVETYACRFERGDSPPLVITVALRGALNFHALATGSRTREMPFLDVGRVSRDAVSTHFDEDVAWGIRSERCDDAVSDDEAHATSRDLMESEAP